MKGKEKSKSAKSPKPKSSVKFEDKDTALKRAEDGLKKAEAAPVAKKAFEPLKLPTLKKVVTVAEKKETVAELNKWSAELAETMSHNIKEMWGFITGDDGRPATDSQRNTYRGEFQEVREAVEAAVFVENDAARKSAREAYVLALVEHCPVQRWALNAVLRGPSLTAQETLPGIEGCEITVEVTEKKAKAARVVKVPVVKKIDKGLETDAPTFLFGDNCYEVTPHLRSAKRIAQIFAAKAESVHRDAGDHFQAEEKRVRAHATTPCTIKEVVEDNRPGTVVLEISSRSKEQGGFYHPGGIAAFHSDGNTIKVVDAAGHFKQRLEEIRQRDRALPLQTLKAEKFDPGRRMPKDLYQDLWYLHGILIDGINDARAKEAREEKHEAFRAECDEETNELLEVLKKLEPPQLDPETFCDDKKNEPGIGLLDLTDTKSRCWKHRDAKGNVIERVFFVKFLMERNDKNQKKIAALPERLKKCPLFENPALFNFADADKLSYPLSAMYDVWKKYILQMKLYEHGDFNTRVPSKSEPEKAEKKPAKSEK